MSEITEVWGRPVYTRDSLGNKETQEVGPSWCHICLKLITALNDIKIIVDRFVNLKVITYDM